MDFIAGKKVTTIRGEQAFDTSGRRNHLGYGIPFEFLWTATDYDGFLGIPMDCYSFLRTPMESYGFLGIPIDYYGILWSTVESYGYRCIPIDSSGLLSIGLLGHSE